MLKACEPRCAIYARRRAGCVLLDVDEQVAKMLAFCSQQRWTALQPYLDGVAPGLAGRPGFARLFRDAADNQFDQVLFWSLTQFSDSGTAAALDKLIQLGECGIEWRSFTEPCLDSRSSCREAVLSSLSVFVAHERAVMSERTMAGLERAKVQGRTGGRPKVACDANEVARLRDEGLSLTEIAKKVGVSRSSVHRMVSGK